MLWLNACNSIKSETVSDAISAFVCLRIAEVLTVKLDFLDDDEDLSLSNIFPKAYLSSHTRDECKNVIGAIRDRLQSPVMYKGSKPLYQYVLYNIIEEWVEYQDESAKEDEVFVDDDLFCKCPDDLRKSIKAELKSSGNEDEFEFWLSSIEDMHYYTDILFEDTDFDETSIRGIVEAAVRNPLAVFGMISFDELDEYVDVMPLDVAEDYLKFRNKMKEEKEKAEAMKSSIGNITINGNVNAPVQVGIDSRQYVSGNFDYKKLEEILGQIESSANQIEKELGENGVEIIKQVSQLKDMCEKKEDTEVVQGKLAKIKTVVVAVAEGVAANGVFALLQRLLAF